MKNINIIHTFLIIFAIVLLTALAMICSEKELWLVDVPLEIF